MIPRCVLVLGSGGREHALAWRLSRDPERPRVLVTPGNDGCADVAERRDVRESDAEGVLALCRREAVDLVVVGPEGPLAAGLADRLEGAGVAVFGPSRAGAVLEASKWSAKSLMHEAGVPTARAAMAETLEAARALLAGSGPPWVIKADGLAAGKGVCVTRERAEAEAFLEACLAGGRFGPSGRRVVVEEFLAGEELSVFAVCDGREAVLLPPARDHKRAFDGDAGPNTGGMGAYAPVPGLAPGVLERVRAGVVQPMLDLLARRGTPYRGLLYCGLMVRGDTLAVVEFNVRFGDPETQAVLPLVEGSLGRLLASAAAGALEPGAVRVAPRAAVTVALTDAGYPEAPRGGGLIIGLEALAGREDVLVFHAGTSAAAEGWRVCGGRAAYVTALAMDVASARVRAYHAVDGLRGTGWRCRHDIAAAAAADVDATREGR